MDIHDPFIASVLLIWTRESSQTTHSFVFESQEWLVTKLSYRQVVLFCFFFNSLTSCVFPSVKKAMVDIYNINKFVKSCCGRWLTDMCPINTFLSLLLFCFFSRPPWWVQEVKVVKEFWLAPPFAFSQRWSNGYCTCGYQTYERMEGRFEGGVACEAGVGGVDPPALGRRGQSSVSALGAVLVLQVVVTVLTNAHWRRDLQSLDLRLETAAPVREGTTGESGGSVEQPHKPFSWQRWSFKEKKKKEIQQ